MQADSTKQVYPAYLSNSQVLAVIFLRLHVTILGVPRFIEKHELPSFFGHHLTSFTYLKNHRRCLGLLSQFTTISPSNPGLLKLLASIPGATVHLDLQGQQINTSFLTAAAADPEAEAAPSDSDSKHLPSGSAKRSISGADRPAR